MNYADPVIEKYFDLIKANTGVFKAYFQGDPIRVPASMLPCLIISKSETRVGPHTNAEDEHGIQLVATVISDVRSDLADNNRTVMGISTLYDIVEGRNADYSLKSNSLLSILRENINVDTALNLRTDLGSITRVDYGTTRQRDPENWSIEAEIQFVAHFTQSRNP